MDAPYAREKSFSDKVSIQNGCTYAITITLNNENAYDNVVHEFNMSIEKIYKHYKYVGELLLFPELTQQGRIHYHGTLKCKDRVKFYATLKKHIRDIGFVCTKKIGDYEKWFQYCNKDQDMIKELLRLTKDQYPLTREIVEEHVEILKCHARSNKKRKEVGPIVYDIKQCNDQLKSIKVIPRQNPPLRKPSLDMPILEEEDTLVELSPLGDGEKQGGMSIYDVRNKSEALSSHIETLRSDTLTNDQEDEIQRLMKWFK